MSLSALALITKLDDLLALPMNAHESPVEDTHSKVVVIISQFSSIKTV